MQHKSKKKGSIRRGNGINVKRNTLKHLKSLHKLYRNSWNDEFQRRFFSPKPEIPLAEPIMEPMVHLGCINGTYVNDLVTASLTVPSDSIGYWINQLLSLQFAQQNNPSFTLDNPTVPANVYRQTAIDLVGSNIYTPGVTSASGGNWISDLRNSLISSDILTPSSGTFLDNVDNNNLNCNDDSVCVTPFDSASTNPIRIQQPSQQSFNGWDSSLGRLYAQGVYGINCGNTRSSGPDSIPCSVAIGERASVISESGDGDVFGFQSNSIASNSIANNNSYTGPDQDIFTLSNPGWQSPFQNNVYLSSNLDLFSSVNNSGYNSVALSHEGLLWSLWPLSTKKNKRVDGTTYFNKFTFGTSIQSQFPIGQIGYFSNNVEIGCTPFGGIYPSSDSFKSASLNTIGIDSTSVATSSDFTGPLEFTSQTTTELNKNEIDNVTGNAIGIMPGVQNFNSTLITTTNQLVALVVIKITEQVARIPNPASSVGGDEAFIYVGYDGWSVVRTTMNPISPMSAQTYITPQSVTGSTVGDNYQIIFPPNFPQAIMYRNHQRTAPTNTQRGLFGGAPFTAGNTK